MIKDILHIISLRYHFVVWIGIEWKRKSEHLVNGIWSFYSIILIPSSLPLPIAFSINAGLLVTFLQNIWGQFISTDNVSEGTGAQCSLVICEVHSSSFISQALVASPPVPVLWSRANSKVYRPCTALNCGRNKGMWLFKCHRSTGEGESASRCQGLPTINPNLSNEIYLHSLWTW